MSENHHTHHEAIHAEYAAAPPVLDLAVPRTILLSDAGRNFRFTCRRLDRADWNAYFDANQITVEQHGKERITTNDVDTPFLVLADRVIERTEGYKVAGGLDFHELPEWRQRIPLAHRKQVGIALASATPSAIVDAEYDPFTFSAEGEVVSIDAAWTANENGMYGFQGLVHKLKTPTEAQHQRFNRQASRSIVVGGSRSGKTIYAGAHEVLCDLYDELVLSVDPAYVWNGFPLSTPKEIRERMDAGHKFIVAQQIFNPRSTVVTVTAKLEGSESE